MAKIFDVQQIVRGKVPAGGRIYIGAYGSNPVDNPGNVFTDENFTVSVATPLTLGVDGRPVDSTGQVLTLYAQDSYSMMIRDKYDADVLPTYWNVEVFDVDPDGNARVNIIQPEDGATGTSVGTTTNKYEWGYFDRINLTFTPGVGDLAQAANVAYVNGIADTKEDDLGNPGVDGYILSSTVAGVRSWIPDGGFDPASNQNITGEWSFTVAHGSEHWIGDDDPITGTPLWYYRQAGNASNNGHTLYSTQSDTGTEAEIQIDSNNASDESNMLVRAGTAKFSAKEDATGSHAFIDGDSLTINTTSTYSGVNVVPTYGEQQLGTSGIYASEVVSVDANNSFLKGYLTAARIALDTTQIGSGETANVQDYRGLQDETTGASPGVLRAVNFFAYNPTGTLYNWSIQFNNGAFAPISADYDGTDGNVSIVTEGNGTAKYNGFEIATKNLEVVSDASATYILSAADNGKHIILTNAGAVNLQIDNGIDTGNGDSVGFNCLIETGNASTDISFTGTATKVNFNGDTKVAVGDGAMVTITSAVNNRYNFTGNTTV